MRDEVTGRARQVFFDSSICHTIGGTGLLIFVSMFERQAIILADQAVDERLGQPSLD